MRLPKHSTSRDELDAQMQAQRAECADWRGERTFSLVYSAGDELRRVFEDTTTIFPSENGRG